MRPGTGRGFMLLPVMLAIAVVGALAFSMTRDGSMGVAAVEAEYDIARVRYLAEAGITLAKWQNEQAGCGRAVLQAGKIAFPGGSVTIDSVDKADHGIAVGVTATVAAPVAGGADASLSLNREIRLHDMSTKIEVTLGDAAKGSDTFIQRDLVYAADTQTYVELTDNSSHGLLRVALADVPRDILVTKAELILNFQSAGQRLATNSLDLHLPTAPWDARTANWASPFPGGGADLGPPIARTAISGGGTHTWRIDGVAQAWANGSLPQHGLLLKPQGLSGVRFDSFEGGNGPRIFLRYYPLCPKK